LLRTTFTPTHSSSSSPSGSSSPPPSFHGNTAITTPQAVPAELGASFAKPIVPPALNESIGTHNYHKEDDGVTKFGASSTQKVERYADPRTDNSKYLSSSRMSFLEAGTDTYTQGRIEGTSEPRSGDQYQSPAYSYDSKYRNEVIENDDKDLYDNEGIVGEHLLSRTRSMDSTSSTPSTHNASPIRRRTGTITDQDAGSVTIPFPSSSTSPPLPPTLGAGPPGHFTDSQMIGLPFAENISSLEHSYDTLLHTNSLCEKTIRTLAHEVQREIKEMEIQRKLRWSQRKKEIARLQEREKDESRPRVSGSSSQTRFTEESGSVCNNTRYKSTSVEPPVHPSQRDVPKLSKQTIEYVRRMQEEGNIIPRKPGLLSGSSTPDTKTLLRASSSRGSSFDARSSCPSGSELSSLLHVADRVAMTESERAQQEQEKIKATRAKQIEELQRERERVLQSRTKKFASSSTHRSGVDVSSSTSHIGVPRPSKGSTSPHTDGSSSLAPLSELQANPQGRHYTIGHIPLRERAMITEELEEHGNGDEEKEDPQMFVNPFLPDDTPAVSSLHATHSPHSSSNKASSSSYFSSKRQSQSRSQLNESSMPCEDNEQSFDIPEIEGHSLLSLISSLTSLVMTWMAHLHAEKKREEREKEMEQWMIDARRDPISSNTQTPSVNHPNGDEMESTQMQQTDTKDLSTSN
ncbi:hypothetical protein ADUPG1_009995, partial [Aduncisulcus paluster]